MQVKDNQYTESQKTKYIQGNKTPMDEAKQLFECCKTSAYIYVFIFIYMYLYLFTCIYLSLKFPF